MSSLKSNELVRVEKLDLVLRVPQFQTQSIRDQFVHFMRSPIQSLRADANRFHVLQEVSFSLKKNERLALIGKNGVGKSTLCRCLAGYYRPQRGKVTIAGQVRAFFDTQVGIVPELTGKENAQLLVNFIFPELYREHDEIVAEALQFSELGGFAHAPYRTYSNGMAARLCLSVITARPSEILILDEVFEGADQFFREKLRPRMMAAIEGSGAVIFVSHDEGQVRSVATRALLIDRAQIAFDGSVNEAFQIFTKLGRPQ